MITLTCQSCGYRFDTTARSNRTRCGRCRSVVKVPLAVRRENGHGAELAPDILVLLLDCGHVSVFFFEKVRATEVSDYVWNCEECGAKEQRPRRYGSMSLAQAEGMTEERFASYVADVAGANVP